MKMRSLSIRRWGVAALSGVTLLGGLSILGASAASAATTPTVSAAVTTTATNIPGTGTGTGANITLTVSGTTLPGDVITLTLACPSAGTASFSSISQNNSTFNTVVAPQNGTTCSTAKFTAGANQTNPVLNLSAITFVTSGVTSQALSISGTYATLGLASTSFTVATDANVVWFSVSANVPAVTLSPSGTTAVSPITITDPSNITPNSSQIAAPPYPGFATVTNFPSAVTPTPTTITEPSPPDPAAGTVANLVINTVVGSQDSFHFVAGSNPITTVTATGLPAGVTLPTTTALAGASTDSALTGMPTQSGSFPVVVTANDGGVPGATAYFTLLVSPPPFPATITLTLSSPGDSWGNTTPTVSAVGSTATVAKTGPQTLTVTVTVPSSGQAAQWTINNASVATTSGVSVAGAQKMVVTYTTASGSAVMFTGVTVGTILGSVTTIYGVDGTADGTVAAEFENAYPANNGGNANVVLATDAANVNGSDALAASYLEGTLHTGLLITPTTSLGTDAQAAIQLEGVTTVYVVGGPLAITPAVIDQIKALPAYTAGGLTLTGKTVNVVGPIYGADGTAAGTAAMIANYFGPVSGSGSFAGAYSASGGAYNDTTGSGSDSGPSSATPTAIVIASSDWQDAMSIAPEAFNMRFPVILNGPSTDASLDKDASAALTSLGVKQVIVIGGQLALQNSVETAIAALNGGISVLRIAGIDATDTAAQLANFALASTASGLGWTPGTLGNHAVIASHADYWSDALGAAALGGGANPTTFGTEPIILVENPLTVGQYTTAELPKLVKDGVSNLTVLGGPLAMPSSTVQTLIAGL